MTQQIEARAGWDASTLEFFAGRPSAVEGSHAGMTSNLMDEYSDAHKACYGCRAYPSLDYTVVELTAAIHRLYDAAYNDRQAEQEEQDLQASMDWEHDSGLSDNIQHMFDTQEFRSTVARR